MTGRTVPLAEEELPAGRNIAGHAALCGHVVQRGHHRGQRIERVGRQIEGRHPRRGNSVSDDVPQALNGARANRCISREWRPLLRATRIVSMTAAAQHGVGALDVRRFLGARPEQGTQRCGHHDDAAADHLGTMSSGMPRPGPPMSAVRMYPSVILKMPGKRSCHRALAAGTYSRAFASMPATAGTRAEMPTDWISDAPGHVRSCTHTNILYFCAAAAISTVWLWPLHAFSATPV